MITGSWYKAACSRKKVGVWASVGTLIVDRTSASPGFQHPTFPNSSSAASAHFGNRILIFRDFIHRTHLLFIIWYFLVIFFICVITTIQPVEWLIGLSIENFIGLTTHHHQRCKIGVFEPFLVAYLDGRLYLMQLVGFDFSSMTTTSWINIKKSE